MSDNELDRPCIGCGNFAPHNIGLVRQHKFLSQEQTVILCDDCLFEMAQRHDLLITDPIEMEIQSLKNGYMPIEFFYETMTEEERIEGYGPNWRKGFTQRDLDWLDAQPPYVPQEVA